MKQETGRMRDRQRPARIRTSSHQDKEPPTETPPARHAQMCLGWKPEPWEERLHPHSGQDVQKRGPESHPGHKRTGASTGRWGLGDRTHSLIERALV